jgi:uncharacterized protein
VKKQRPHEKKRAAAARRKARRAVVAQRVKPQSTPRSIIQRSFIAAVAPQTIERSRHVGARHRVSPRSATRPTWQHQSDVRAAILVLVPALLTASLFLPTQRAKHATPETSQKIAGAPLAQTATGLQRRPQQALNQSFAGGASVAAQTSIPASPRLALSLPSATFNETETTAVAASSDPTPQSAVADAQASPYVRPPEAYAATVPVAVHDLAYATAALAADIQANRPVYTRPAEALVAALPTADDLLPKADLTPEAPFTRVPEAMIAALPYVHAVEPHTPRAEVVASAPVAQLTCPAPAGLLAAKTAPPRPAADPDLANDPLKFGRALAAAAQAQTRDLVVYNPAYMTIAYPGGDVPRQFGVCTDVVIRAYRALDIDLQELVHLSRPGRSDTNIDHRRTDLLRGFFATYGEQIAITPYIEDYLPGDIVTYYRPQNKSSTAHIALVSDVTAPSGRPMIVHNRGWGVQLEDALFVDQITGHYRFRGIKTATNVAVATTKAKERTSLAADTGASAGDLQPSLPSPARQKLTATALRLAALKPTLANGPRMGLGLGNTSPAPRCDLTAKSCIPSNR